MNRMPLFVHCCHCRWCQRETGASFALNALLESNELEVLKGHPERVDIPSESGSGQSVFRCPDCQVALWSHYGGGGGLLSFVRVGSLDQAELLSPDVHIYVESKQPWVVIPDGVPVFEQYYDAREQWPAESIERFKVLKND
jgi:hypothetical protein